jgi:hypothetical protein
MQRATTRLPLGLLLTTGCQFPASGVGDPGLVPDAAGARDGAVLDAAGPPAPDATPCLGFAQSPIIFGSCDIPDPGGVAFEIPSNGTYVVDTDAGTVRKGNDPPLALPAAAFVAQTTPGLPEVFVIAGAGVTIKSGVSLTVTGTRALALVSTGDLAIGGFIRATPREVGGNVVPGPGAAPALCATGNGAPGMPELNAYGENAAGGGGGGGFGGPGGDGGPVWRPADDAGDVASGGGAMAAAGLRGGCWGGDGDAALEGGAGGAPGGGVALIAVGTVSVNGGNAVVTTSGFGGQAADRMSPGGGGGGGGSGGSIWIVAAALQVDGGALTASGGGGGEGDSAAGDQQPKDGEDGKTESAAPAAGGDDTWGGDGGDGAGPTLDVPATPGLACTQPDNDHDGCGGGGGGGGPGYIFVRADQVQTTGPYVVAPTLTRLD